MRNNKVLLVCLIGLAMLLVGCGSDVHKVIIEPSAERVDMDEELILTAIGFDEEGRMMALDTRAYWLLSDEHMGDIKAVSRDQAVFIPIREGSVTIYVKVGKATGNLTVDVGQKIIAVRADKYIDTNSKISKLNDSAYPAIVQTNQEGSWIAWEIELPRKSFYTPVILYACDKSVTRELVIEPEEPLSVDDQSGLIQQITFPASGGMGKVKDEWQTMVLEPVFLDAGHYRIYLQNSNGSAGNLSLAWIALVYPIELTEDDYLITTVNKLVGF